MPTSPYIIRILRPTIPQRYLTFFSTEGLEVESTESGLFGTSHSEEFQELAAIDEERVKKVKYIMHK